MKAGIKKTKPGSERGTALILAIVMLAVFGILGTAYWQHLHFTLSIARAFAKEQAAHALAESGIERAVAEIRAGHAAFTGAGPERVGEGFYTVHVARATDGSLTLESTGALGDAREPLHACTLHARVPAGAARVEWLTEEAR